MDTQRKRRMVALLGLVLALGAVAADRPVGTTMPRAPVPLDSHAMNAMLRADTDKDGYLSREEIERYDMTLARRLKEVDADGDGRLTFYEFEKLMEPPEASAKR